MCIDSLVSDRKIEITPQCFNNFPTPHDSSPQPSFNFKFAFYVNFLILFLIILLVQSELC